MVRVIIALFALLAFVVSISPASAHRARHHYQHQHARHSRHVVAVSVAATQFNLFAAFTPAVPQSTSRSSVVTFAEHQSENLGSARPHDCYGIAWCGCFLRHKFGIADKSFNLARRWASAGSASHPHSGAIIVWPHHVGQLQSDPDAEGRALILSGNDGGGIRIRLRSIKGAIAFRDL